MSHEITGVGYWVLTLMGYVVIFSVVPAVLWIIISNYWVYRRGQLQGLVMWHKRTINVYGFNDAVHSLKILGLSLVTLIFCLPSPSDPLSAFCTLLSTATFLITAALVAERRRHWDMLKTSAREVILEHYSNNSR
jgi:hypothetical protein